MSQTKKPIPIEEFVKKMGSQEKAAHAIGVSFATLNRWLKGHFQPSDLAMKKLEQLGIGFKINKK